MKFNLTFCLNVYIDAMSVSVHTVCLHFTWQKTLDMYVSISTHNVETVKYIDNNSVVSLA